MTSPPFAPHPFGDHSRFSPCAGATGKLVLTARVLGEGGARPAGTGPAPGLRYGQHCACWDPEARSPAATSCLLLWHLPAELGSRPASRQDRTGSQLREALLRAQSGSRVPSGESGLLGRPGSECFRKQEEHATAALKAALGVSWCLEPPAHRGGADAVSTGGLWALQAEA